MATTTTCPEAILASIPWYPEGLTAEECGAVEAHAADCRECRAELAFVRGDEEPAIELPDAERVYARVLERISAHGDEEPAPPRRRSVAREAARQASLAAGILVAVISGMLTTGAIWIAEVESLYRAGTFYGPGHIYFPVDWAAGIDIDTPDDLELARAML